MSHTVFISRNEEDCEELSKALSAEGIALIAVSMIKTEPVKFEQSIPQTDWIFFSSKNGVRTFFSQNPEIGSQRFAAVGQGTADVLNEFAKVDFIGKHIDTRITAQEFKEHIENATVLFPQSSISRKTIVSAFDNTQAVEIVCYKTQEESKEVGAADVFIFTSPSNVDSFFKKNKVFHYQKMISFGFPTEETLKKHGVENIVIPESLDTETLIRTIKAQL